MFNNLRDKKYLMFSFDLPSYLLPSLPWRPTVTNNDEYWTSIVCAGQVNQFSMRKILDYILHRDAIRTSIRGGLYQNIIQLRTGRRKRTDVLLIRGSNLNLEKCSNSLSVLHNDTKFYVIKYSVEVQILKRPSKSYNIFSPFLHHTQN